MIVVSSREFRANQKKYLDLAKDGEVLITSRTHGSYRLVPVSEGDVVVDEGSLQGRIRKGIAEFELGKSRAISEGESVESFLMKILSEK